MSKMKKIGKIKKSQVLALIMTVVLTISMFPVGIITNVFAQNIKSFDVKLGAYTENADVKLTNTADPLDTKTVEAVKGIATFDGFVDDGKTYNLNITKLIGYKDYEKKDISLKSGQEVYDISDLEAIAKVMISGMVQDEKALAYSGALITYSAYAGKIKGTTTTDANGVYSFEAYEGQEYEINATTNDAQYEAATSKITNPTAGADIGIIKLAVKQFKITTTAGADGTITAGETVSYGTNKEIVVVANNGFRINELKVDGVAITDANGKQNYKYLFENIQAEHSISVTFIQQEYKVTFNVSENGNVTYDGSTNIVAGGSINVEKSFAESTDPTKPTTVRIKATPNANYRVSKVIIDGVSAEVPAENDKVYDTTMEMTTDHSFTVEFSLNTFAVTVTSGGNGTAKPDKQTVDYNGKAVVTITPNDNTVTIDKITVTNDASSDEINLETDRNYDKKEDGISTYTIDGVKSNTSLEVTFKAVVHASGSWQDKVSILPKENSGKLMKKPYKDKDKNAVYVYSKDTELIMQAKPPYDHTDYHIFGKKKNEYEGMKSNFWNRKITNSVKIDNIQVQKGSLGEKVSILPDEVFNGIIIIIDKTKPELKDITLLKEWSKDETVKVSGEATDNPENNNSKKYDPSSGLSHVVWSKGKELSDADVLNEATNTASIDVDGKYSFEVKGEQNSTYHVYAVDFSGNVSKGKTVQVKIDRTAPAITNFEFKKTDKTTTEKAINFLSFGTFFKETILVTVTATDESISSGVNSITLNGITKKVDEKNQSTFELTLKEFKDGKDLSATTTDKAGNISALTSPTSAGVTTNAKSNKVKITDTAPIISITPQEAIYTDKDKKNWYSKNDVSFTVTATDEEVGIYSVVIKINGEEIKKDVNGIAISDSNENHFYDKESPIERIEFIVNTSQAENKGKVKDGENTIEVIVTNNAGVESVVTQNIYIDTTKPDVTKFAIIRTGNTPVEKVINFLTFGTFFNDELQVKVSAGDNNATAGLKEITLFATDKDGKSIKIGDKPMSVTANNDCTFTIPTEAVADNKKIFDMKLSATATDNVGNTTETAVSPNETNSGGTIKNSGLMIETVKPTIDITPQKAIYTDKDANNWYNNDIQFNVSTGDDDSGIQSVSIKINDSEINDSEITNAVYKNNQTHKEDFVINTEKAVRAEDGSYTVVVMVVDNAGNTYEQSSKVFKDIDAPYITEFKFNPVGIQEANGANTTVEETDYGFYFMEDTEVTISSKDKVPTAGVKSISYYTVDKNGGKSEVKDVDVNNENQIKFIIPANFKGQIYAKATDNVSNTFEDFINPNSAIVESPDKHKEENHIVFEKAATEYKDNDGIELYATDTDVKLTVKDTYSGLRKVEWSVTSPYDEKNNQIGSFEIKNDKSYVDGGNSEGWKQTATEKNLVTEMSKTIKINNNSNAIIVKVKITDRAGNTSEEFITFSIDKSMPTIDVIYDNNTPDVANKDYYKADRMATIVITERNFTASDIIYKITNTDGVIPELSEWKTEKNADDPDKTTHTATVKYTADGDYTFDISYKDNAKNEAKAFAEQAFTMDKTMPVIGVTYDNVTALNGNYYAADRTATITINEHNFETSRVVVTGIATDDGTAITFPQTSEWVTKGDEHTATVNYTADAKYSFDIAYIDMAGNAATDYAVEEFYVDKTAPTLAISGVADKSANQGNVIPVITYYDTNYNANGISTNLSGINKGVAQIDGAYSDVKNGQVFTFANFKKEQAFDDIYTLTTKVADFAGNETAQTITFSVNRFGSVYVLDDSLKSILNKYVKEETNVILTETNVDSFKTDTIKVKMTKNGTPMDLAEGTDYSIERMGGNGNWSQNKYTINKSLFSGDGKYTVTLYSEDAAGNINENIDETKNAQVSFGIDKTAPVIVPIDFESGEQYPIETKNVVVSIKDNLVLSGVKIYLNDKEVTYKNEGENYTFDIASVNSKQKVKIVAVDAAENEHTVDIDNFLVSTNLFVRWFNNTPLFIGSIVGVCVIGLSLAVFLIFFKKKKGQ